MKSVPIKFDCISIYDAFHVITQYTSASILLARQTTSQDRSCTRQTMSWDNLSPTVYYLLFVSADVLIDPYKAKGYADDRDGGTIQMYCKLQVAPVSSKSIISYTRDI